MHISLGGLCIEIPEKLWRILCNSFKCLLLHNFMANSAIILYSGFLVGLISQFENLGQSNLVKNIIQNVLKIVLETISEPPVRLQWNLG